LTLGIVIAEFGGLFLFIFGFIYIFFAGWLKTNANL